MFLLVYVAVVPATAKTWINLASVERAYLVEHSVIRVHNKTDWLPFNFFGDGMRQGFFIHYIKFLVTMIGIKVK